MIRNDDIHSRYIETLRCYNWNKNFAFIGCSKVWPGIWSKSMSGGYSQLRVFIFVSEPQTEKWVISEGILTLFVSDSLPLTFFPINFAFWHQFISFTITILYLLYLIFSSKLCTSIVLKMILKNLLVRKSQSELCNLSLNLGAMNIRSTDTLLACQFHPVSQYIVC